MPRSCAVFGSAISALSSTISAFDFALEDSACFKASTRTFLGRSCAWLRGTGPKARPPPRNCGRLVVAVTGLARALLLINLLVRAVYFAPALRLVRAGLPLGQLIADHALQDVRARLECRKLRRSARCFRRRTLEGHHIGLHFAPASAPAPAPLCSGLRNAPRLRRRFGQRPLHGIAKQDPAALGAGNSAANEDQPTLYVGANHLQILGGDALVAIWPAIFLPLKVLPGSWRLPVEPWRAVRDRNAMRGAQTTRNSSVSWRR